LAEAFDIRKDGRVNFLNIEHHEDSAFGKTPFDGVPASKKLIELHGLSPPPNIS
jgi:hypothetical protein